MQNQKMYCFFLACTGGYYQEELVTGKGFRMLVLNTNLYYDQNQQTTNMEDPADQLSWVDQVLSQAAINKEKVKHSEIEIIYFYAAL